MIEFQHWQNRKVWPIVCRPSNFMLPDPDSHSNQRLPWLEMTDLSYKGFSRWSVYQKTCSFHFWNLGIWATTQSPDTAHLQQPSLRNHQWLVASSWCFLVIFPWFLIRSYGLTLTPGLWQIVGCHFRSRFSLSAEYPKNQPRLIMDWQQSSSFSYLKSPILGIFVVGYIAADTTVDAVREATGFEFKVAEPLKTMYLVRQVMATHVIFMGFHGIERKYSWNVSWNNNGIFLGDIHFLLDRNTMKYLSFWVCRKLVSGPKSWYPESSISRVGFSMK